MLDVLGPLKRRVENEAKNFFEDTMIGNTRNFLRKTSRG